MASKNTPKSSAKKTSVKTKKKTAKKKVAKKPASKKTSTRNKKISVTPEQHHKMICEAAYYISLGRTSETVNPTEDWLQAETAINKIYTISDS